MTVSPNLVYLAGNTETFRACPVPAPDLIQGLWLRCFATERTTDVFDRTLRIRVWAKRRICSFCGIAVVGFINHAC